MKYAILVGDGMSDYPIGTLGNKTPLDVAKIPNMNDIVKHGMIGLVKTVPSGMKPASDVATANQKYMGSIAAHTILTEEDSSLEEYLSPSRT